MMTLGAFAMGLILVQGPALAILLARLLRGPGRRSPLAPTMATPELTGTVSVVVPTLNEAARIGPCLAGLSCQGDQLREALIVDSRSTDGTPNLVLAAQVQDPRLRLLTDPPLPKDWVGRPWALHHGFLASHPESEWILGIDADTQPNPSLVASLVTAAHRAGYDLVSLSPRFILRTPGEWWLQPALLITLVYRFGPAGADECSERVMANGQCFLVRRSLLESLGGYTVARQSFCDDVTLARYAAAQGARVGFWDGANLIKVRMYEGMAETWREWGRSLDLKDAAALGQTWGDVLFLVAVQGVPIWGCLGLGLAGLNGMWFPSLIVALGLNVLLLGIRFALLGAIAPSYDWDAQPLKNLIAFGLSPFADSLAVARIALSASRKPTQWRGRLY